MNEHLKRAFQERKRLVFDTFLSPPKYGKEKRAIKKSVLKNVIAKYSCKLKKCFFTVKYNIEIEVCSIANAELSSVNMVSHILNFQCRLNRIAFM